MALVAGLVGTSLLPWAVGQTLTVAMPSSRLWPRIRPRPLLSTAPMTEPIAMAMIHVMIPVIAKNTTMPPCGAFAWTPLAAMIAPVVAILPETGIGRRSS